MRILVINGPNLNTLGDRQVDMYGSETLENINSQLTKKANELSVDIEFFQSNSEGDIIDYIQSSKADGIIINPGALTHYGFSLRDALADTQMAIAEVHLSNIYAREEWRQKSVVSPVANGQIVGFGWRGYISALDLLVSIITKES